MRRGLPAMVVGALFTGLLLLSGSALGQQTTRWPSEQEQRLKDLDSQLLDAQRRRFAARFGNDKEMARLLDREFKEIQKERRQVLRATGRMP